MGIEKYKKYYNSKLDKEWQRIVETNNQNENNLFEFLAKKNAEKSGINYKPEMDVLEVTKREYEKEIFIPQEIEALNIEIQSLKNTPTINNKHRLLYKKRCMEFITDKSIHQHILTFFHWKGTSEQLDELYSQLVNIDKPIINSTIETFKMAFSGDVIIQNLEIKWLVISKNKHTSKSSLFYFIRMMENENLITQEQDALNHRVRNIFVDSEGTEFINIKQSKYSDSTKPARSQDLEQAISAIISNKPLPTPQ
ncbi:MAG: hypothetical protein COC01_04970 [Bacteroidetes bacterium]|nr:MAG: hypothetical protein COC01_04970 [Bacteroidota bacterium]